MRLTKHKKINILLIWFGNQFTGSLFLPVSNFTGFAGSPRVSVFLRPELLSNLFLLLLNTQVSPPNTESAICYCPPPTCHCAFHSPYLIDWSRSTAPLTTDCCTNRVSPGECDVIPTEADHQLHVNGTCFWYIATVLTSPAEWYELPIHGGSLPVVDVEKWLLLMMSLIRPEVAG